MEYEIFSKSLETRGATILQQAKKTHEAEDLKFESRIIKIVTFCRRTMQACIQIVRENMNSKLYVI